MPETLDYLPGPQEQLLLRALLLEDAGEAQAAAAAWLDRHDPVRVNEGVRRLMPLLNHRMTGWGLQHPARPALGAIQRHYWLLDQQLRRQLADLMDLLADTGGPVILLKGLSLGLTVYPAPWTRPMSDLDILLPEPALAQAAERLRAAGFLERHGTFHAVMFLKPGHLEIDLHRSPYQELFVSEVVAPVLARAVPLEGVLPGAFRLCDTDQLLHTITHGLRPNAVSPLRWMVDATLLLRHAGAGFDWVDFRAEAERLGLFPLVRRGLEEMQSVLGLQYPAGLLADPPAGGGDAAAALRERHSQGPIALWRRTRGNASFLGRIALIARNYGWRIREDGVLFLARQGVFWLREYLFRRNR